MTKNQFSFHHIPQSEYRKSKASKEVARQEIKTELPPLDIQDENLKLAMIKKVDVEIEKIVSILLPENKIASFQNSACLADIFSQLGLK